MEPAELMQLAIDAARQGVALGQSPFGCAIARRGQLLSAEHNTVIATTDITAHAEINALRSACRSAGEVHLRGAAVATTCEPCPMCLAALHWAQVETVYFGATIADAVQGGFNELTISADEMVRLGNSPLQIVPGVLAEACKQLFDDWLALPQRRAY